MAFVTEVVDFSELSEDCSKLQVVIFDAKSQYIIETKVVSLNMLLIEYPRCHIHTGSVQLVPRHRRDVYNQAEQYFSLKLDVEYAHTTLIKLFKRDNAAQVTLLQTDYVLE